MRKNTYVHRVATVMAVIATITPATIAPAATVNWTANSSTNFNWGDAFNWDLGVPTAADDAIFGILAPNPGALPNPNLISLGAGSLANSLSLQGGTCSMEVISL